MKQTEIKLLSIDDEKGICNSIASFFEDYDYITFKAYGGKEGIRLFDEKEPNVVITDLMMPDISGFDVVQHIKEKSPNTPIVVVSGAGTISDVMKAIRIGAWDYISKPIEDLNLLKHTVEASLERSHLLKQREENEKFLEMMVNLRTKELRGTVKKLQESEEDLRTILQSIGDMVIVTDSSGSIRKMNTAAEKGLNVTFDNLYGHNFNNICSILDSKTLDKVNIPFNEKYCPKKPILLTNNTLKIEHYETSLFVVGSISPLFVLDNYASGFVIALTDITKQKIIERKAHHSQKMESIGRLAGGITHDFKNMLGGVLGLSELILQDLESGEMKDMISTIAETVNSALDMTSKLLSFSRDEKEEYKPIDIHKTIMDTVVILSHTINKNIAISTSLNAEQYNVIGNSSELQSTLLNLGINARDSMPQGGRIEISTSNKHINESYCSSSMEDLNPGKYIHISVKDTGTGIPQNIIDKVFEPFFTTKESGKGTGLGLSAVYGTIKSHKGEITIDTKINIGTTFNILLPIEN